jgi:ribosomal protein L16 Arg81 hydroxylase
VSHREINISNLLAPMTPDKFLDRFYQRRPLHVKGHAKKFESWFSWDRLNRILNATPLWDAPRLRLVRDHQTMAPASFSRPASDETAGAVLRAVPAMVNRHLAEGATINLNEVEQLDDNLAAISAMFAMAFNARSNCNLYLSRREVVAFPSHFDPTDVFVLHVAGKKRWRIYERPFEAPAYADGYNNGSFPDAYHEANKGRVLTQVSLAPGDLLYIPAGYYHDALAESDVSLHLTFSLEQVRGLVTTEILESLLAADPVFRKPLPDPDDISAHDEHIRMLAERIRDALCEPEIAAQIRAQQKNHAYWDVPRYTLPATELEQVFRVRTLRLSLRKTGDSGAITVDGKEVLVDAVLMPLVTWIIQCESFSAAALLAEFSDSPREHVQATIDLLGRAQAIELLDPYLG